MQFTSLLVAAVAAAQVHWVPLNSQQAKQQQGQVVAPAPAAPVMPSRSQANLGARLLRAGTLVSLSPLQEISSKHMRAGDRFSFLVVQDVVDDGVVVIPRGSNATGVVTAQTGRAI